MINSYSGGLQPPGDSCCPLVSAGATSCHPGPRARLGCYSSPPPTPCQGFQGSGPRRLAFSTTHCRELGPAWPKGSKTPDPSSAGSAGTGPSLPGSSDSFASVRFLTRSLWLSKALWGELGRIKLPLKSQCWEGQVRRGWGGGARVSHSRTCLWSGTPSSRAGPVGTREMGGKCHPLVLHSCFC